MRVAVRSLLVCVLVCVLGSFLASGALAGETLTGEALAGSSILGGSFATPEMQLLDGGEQVRAAAEARRVSPGAVVAREESQSKYVGLNGADAAKLAREAFPAVIGESALTPVDAQGAPLAGSEGSVEGTTVFYANTQTDADTSDLCEAIGPFERDAQKLGRMLGTYRPAAKSGRSEQAMANVLTALIADSRHVVATLDRVGAPDIGGGHALATETVATFDEIEQSDAEWRSELRAGIWVWPTASRVKRERLRTSFQALMLVGRQIERLPLTRERHNAMAHSPVCRDVFGSVRVGGQRQARWGAADES
jgi:hypothetical protein